MPIPLLALAGKYALGKGLESAGLPAGLANPKGYVMGQLKSGVDSALGVMPGTTNFVTDPKGAITGMAKDAAKDAFKDMFTDSPGQAAPAAPAPSSSEPEDDDYDSDSSGMDGGFGGMPEMPNSGYQAYKRGGKVKAKSSKMLKPAPKTSMASRRGDGIAQRGKTKGRMR